MNRRVIVLAAVAVAAAACGSDPAYYDQPRYSSAPYYSTVADSGYGQVVAIDVVGGSGRSSGAGAVIGGIVGGVLGHQVGSGRGNDVATVGGAVAGAAIGANTGRGGQTYSQDVQRCANVSSGMRPEYYDVTYNFNGIEHRVQLSSPPGPTIAVNPNGEPRG
jgi:uncharacterized protein YcfJ